MSEVIVRYIDDGTSDMESPMYVCSSIAVDVLTVVQQLNEDGMRITAGLEAGLGNCFVTCKNVRPKRTLTVGRGAS